MGAGVVEAVAKININTSYLNLPIVAKYYVIDKLDSEAGPQFGLLLAARMKASVKVNDMEMLNPEG